MSDTAAPAERDETSGRFVSGNTGGPGRKPGSRNRLGEAFLEDLKNSWNECGAVALKRAAEEDPVGYCRIVASLLPKDINIDVKVDVAEFAGRFRSALAMLGNEPELPRRRPMRVIDNAG